MEFLINTKHLDLIAPLLRSAVTTDEQQALAHWLKWREMKEVWEFNLDELRTLPLAWYKLRQVLPKDDLYNLIKGWYKKVYTQNSLLLHETKEICQALEAEGIDVALMKGLPLLVDVYPTLGCRQTSDADLLVSENQKAQTMAFMQKQGWSTAWAELNNQDIAKFRKHSVGYYKDRHKDIDIHWRAMNWDYPLSIDQGLIRRKHQISFKDQPYQALCPSDLFFHCMINHSLYNKETLLPWIMDVSMLDQQYDIDYQQVFQHIQECHVLPLARDLMAMAEYLLPGNFTLLKSLVDQAVVPAYQKKAYSYMFGNPLKVIYLNSVVMQGDLEHQLGSLESYLKFLGYVFQTFRIRTKQEPEYPVELLKKIPRYTGYVFKGLLR